MHFLCPPPPHAPPETSTFAHRFNSLPTLLIKPLLSCCSPQSFTEEEMQASFSIICVWEVIWEIFVGDYLTQHNHGWCSDSTQIQVDKKKWSLCFDPGVCWGAQQWRDMFKGAGFEFFVASGGERNNCNYKNIQTSKFCIFLKDTYVSQEKKTGCTRLVIDVYHLNCDRGHGRFKVFLELPPLAVAGATLSQQSFSEHCSSDDWWPHFELRTVQTPN